MPSPSLLCTLHIGGANLPSRATCDSTVAPAVAHGRPGALGSADMQDAPGASATSGQRKPFGAVISIRSHDYHGNERAHATGGGFPDARLLLLAGRVHLVCIAQGICSWHARMLTQIGRQRPL